MQKVVYNWSGGKDSSYALWKLMRDGNYKVEYLLTTLSDEYKRISMHGVPENLLDFQAKSLGLKLRKIFLPEDSSSETYNKLMVEEMKFATSHSIYKAVFGDIFLQDLKDYRETQLKKTGMKGIYPIWGLNTKELVRDFVDQGFKAVVVSANASILGKDFCGRIIDHDFIDSLPDNVDPCGENGEFHSFVFDGPIFKDRIDIKIGKTILKEYKVSKGIDSKFWYCDINSDK